MAALPRDGEKRRIARNCGTAAAKPVRSPAARTVEQFEQRQHAAPRRALLCASASAVREKRFRSPHERGSSAVDAGSSARQRMRRIIIAQPFVDEETRRTAAVRKPCAPASPGPATTTLLSQFRQLRRAGRPPAPCRSIPRPVRGRAHRRAACCAPPRARWRASRGNRRSKPCPRQARATASAAIIRASASRPTRRSADTI